MAIIDPFSKVYAFVIGKYVGRTCVIRDSEKHVPGLVQVVFIDNDRDEKASVKIGELAQLEMPGWPAEIYHSSYGIKEHFERHHGSGTNMLRTQILAQPRVLRKDDVLATKESVVEIPRSGYNSSCLVRLSCTGWVKLAPRLPVALLNNRNFKLPIELRIGQKLATGCLIVKKPDSSCLDWVKIYLDKKDCCIKVPSCIPLALA